MISLRNAILGATLVLFSAGNAAAFEVLIDSFDFATANNTRTIILFFGEGPESGLDVGLPNVLGGSRQIDVTNQGAPFFEAGVVAGDVFDFMTSSGGGSGEVTIGYDGTGAGLGGVLARCENIVLTFQDVDDDAVPDSELTLVLNDGVVTESDTRALTAPGSGTLTFPLANFPTVDRTQLSRIGLFLDGSAAADFAIDTIRATDCTAPESPAPALGFGPLAMATGMLIGLGFVGFRRRFT